MVNPRVEYEMTDEELKAVMEASKPTVYMMVDSHAPPSPQENANRAWAELGRKRGFDHMTVRPSDSKGTKFFTAVPSETKAQKTERVAREESEKRSNRIGELEGLIQSSQTELDKLKEEDR